MPTINIQLPNMEADQSIEIEVKINGKKKRYNYRVEIFHWTECRETENRAECIRHIIKNYDQHWQVVQIGGPTDDYIPLMFKQVSN